MKKIIIIISNDFIKTIIQLMLTTINVCSDSKIITTNKINLHEIGVLGISHSDNCMDFFD